MESETYLSVGHPGLAVRSIVQYNSTLAGRNFTSLQSTKSLGVDFLGACVVHPGTAVYAGYSSHMQNLDRTLAATPARLARTRNAFLNGDRRVFVKVSYLFRF